MADVSKNIFSSSAEFVAYACKAAYAVSGGTSLIHRAANAWGIKTYGDNQDITLGCLDAKLGDCDINSLKYFNIVPRSNAPNEVKANSLKILDEYGVDGRPGELKPNLALWKHVDFDSCGTSGACKTDAVRIFPKFFDVVEYTQ